ncbi:hypothetical protein D3C72_1785780 [compost metagenome]
MSTAPPNSPDWRTVQVFWPKFRLHPCEQCPPRRAARTWGFILQSWPSPVLVSSSDSRMWHGAISTRSSVGGQTTKPFIPNRLISSALIMNNSPQNWPWNSMNGALRRTATLYRALGGFSSEIGSRTTATSRTITASTTFSIWRTLPSWAGLRYCAHCSNANVSPIRRRTRTKTVPAR